VFEGLGKRPELSSDRRVRKKIRATAAGDDMPTLPSPYLGHSARCVCVTAVLRARPSVRITVSDTSSGFISSIPRSPTKTFGSDPIAETTTETMISLN
jgi:hypothetical protein